MPHQTLNNTTAYNTNPYNQNYHQIQKFTDQNNSLINTNRPSSFKTASNNSLTSNIYNNQTHSQYLDNNLPNNNTSKFNSTTYQIPDSIPSN